MIRRRAVPSYRRWAGLSRYRSGEEISPSSWIARKRLSAQVSLVRLVHRQGAQRNSARRKGSPSAVVVEKKRIGAISRAPENFVSVSLRTMRSRGSPLFRLGRRFFRVVLGRRWGGLLGEGDVRGKDAWW